MAMTAQSQNLGQVYPQGIDVMHIGAKGNSQEQPPRTSRACPRALRGAICQPQPLNAPPPYEPPNPLPDVRVEMNAAGSSSGATMTGEQDPGSTDEVSLYDQNQALPPGAKMPGQMPVHLNVKHSLRGLPHIPGTQQIWANPGNPGGKANIMTNYQGGVQQTLAIAGTDGNPGVQIHGISPFSQIVHVNSLKDVPETALTGGVHAVTMPVADAVPAEMQGSGADQSGQAMPTMPNAQVGGLQVKQEASGR